MFYACAHRNQTPHFASFRVLFCSRAPSILCRPFRKCIPKDIRFERLPTHQALLRYEFPSPESAGRPPLQRFESKSSPPVKSTARSGRTTDTGKTGEYYAHAKKGEARLRRHMIRNHDTVLHDVALRILLERERQRWGRRRMRCARFLVRTVQIVRIPKPSALKGGLKAPRAICRCRRRHPLLNSLPPPRHARARSRIWTPRRTGAGCLTYVPVARVALRGHAHIVGD